MTRARLHILAAAALIGMPLPVAAQTQADAARANVQLSVALCAQGLFREERLPNSFRQAGFTDAGTTGTNDSTVYHFRAPADTVAVEARYYTCNIDTTFVPVSQAINLVGGVLPQIGLRPRGQQGSTPPLFGQSGKPCMSFIVAREDDLPINIYIGNLGPNPGQSCIEDGTSRIWFEIPG